MNLVNLTPTKAASERGRLAGLEARRAVAADLGKEIVRNGELAWHIPQIERISAAEFEEWLVTKFGPEYLQPVQYQRDGQTWKPVIVEGESV